MSYINMPDPNMHSFQHMQQLWCGFESSVACPCINIISKNLMSIDRNASTLAVSHQHVDNHGKLRKLHVHCISGPESDKLPLQTAMIVHLLAEKAGPGNHISFSPTQIGPELTMVSHSICYKNCLKRLLTWESQNPRDVAFWGFMTCWIGPWACRLSWIAGTKGSLLRKPGNMTERSEGGLTERSVPEVALDISLIKIIMHQRMLSKTFVTASKFEK